MIRDPQGSYTASVEDGLSLTLLVPIAGAALLLSDHLRTPYDDLFDRIGLEEGTGPDLLRAIARRESGFRANSVSPPNNNGTRDYGIMQINEVTARALGVDDPTTLSEGNGRVERSIRLAARFIRMLWRELGAQANLYTVVAAYNAGSPAIRDRGIFNTPYVWTVLYHHQLYTFGSLLRQKGGPA